MREWGGEGSGRMGEGGRWEGVRRRETRRIQGKRYEHKPWNTNLIQEEILFSMPETVHE